MQFAFIKWNSTAICVSLNVPIISFAKQCTFWKILQPSHGSITQHSPEEGHGSIVKEALGASFLVLPVMCGWYLHQVGGVSVLHPVVCVNVVVHIPVADRLRFHVDVHLQTSTITSTNVPPSKHAPHKCRRLRRLLVVCSIQTWFCFYADQSSLFCETVEKL